jgi:hypothetical protein
MFSHGIKNPITQFFFNPAANAHQNAGAEIFQKTTTGGTLPEVKTRSYTCNINSGPVSMRMFTRQLNSAVEAKAPRLASKTVEISLLVCFCADCIKTPGPTEIAA